MLLFIISIFVFITGKGIVKIGSKDNQTIPIVFLVLVSSKRKDMRFK